MSSAPARDDYLYEEDYKLALSDWKKQAAAARKPNDPRRSGPKRSTTIRITEEGRSTLEALSHKLGISQASVLEIAIRKLAQAELTDEER